MCFYREDKLLAKRAFSKLGRTLAAPVVQAPVVEQQEPNAVKIEESLDTKQQTLHEPTSSHSSHLPIISQPHPSTEVSADHSESSMDSPKAVIQSHNFSNALINDELANMILNNYVAKKIHVASAPINMLRIAPPVAQVKNVAPVYDNRMTQEIFKMIQINTAMMKEIDDFQEDVEIKLRTCIKAIRECRERFSSSQPKVSEKITKIQQAAQEAEKHNNNPTSLALFNHLFGNKIYRYELVLTNKVPSLVLRDKNLVLKMELVDTLTGEIVHNSNRIHLHVQMQTWEIPSTNVTRNKNGNKAVTGQTETEIKGGYASLERVQISEVTSKFMNGYVAVVVVPGQPSNFGTYLPGEEEQENFVNYEDIKPLMLEKIIVKSKKKPHM